jgi:hypothetical protein
MSAAEAQRYRQERKEKAHRLASGDPHIKPDSSDWTPPELLEANHQTGLKPISPRQYRKGGRVHHVEGEHEHKRADRKPRASGGRNLANSIATTNEKAANKEEFGAEHIGALRHGGRARAHKLYGGPLAPALAAGYPGGGGDVPAARMGFQGGPSQLSRAIGIKEGGKVKRAKGGRIGKFMGGGFGGMGGASSPGAAQPMAQTPAALGPMAAQGLNAPNMPMPQFNGAQFANTMQGKLGGDWQSQPWMQPWMQNPGSPGAAMQNWQDQQAGTVPTNVGMPPMRAKGGKVRHSDEAEDKRLIREEVRPGALRRASGGRTEHTELHHADCRCAKCTGGMTRGGHVEHHHPDCRCAKCRGGSIEAMEGSRPTGGRIAHASGGKADHWIAGATKNKGALHRELHVPEGQKIPAKKLTKAEHSKNPVERKRADLAKTLKGLNHKEGGEVREHHAKGGRAKGKQTVNIIIAPGGQRPSGMNPMAAPPQPPHPAQPIPMPSPPPMMPGGMPYPMPMGGASPMAPPMGGLGGMPPPNGIPPRPFKHGGYAGAKAGEGAGGGEGRLKKRRAYGHEARGAGPNQAV